MVHVSMTFFLKPCFLVRPVELQKWTYAASAVFLFLLPAASAAASAAGCKDDGEDCCTVITVSVGTVVELDESIGT